MTTEGFVDVNKKPTNDPWAACESHAERVQCIHNQLYSIENTKKPPSVQFYRSWIPRVYGTCYGSKTKINPKAKVDWKKPTEWPDHIEFGDPNNGVKTAKFKRKQLEPMFDQLVVIFKKKYGSIYENQQVALPTDMGSVLQPDNRFPENFILQNHRQGDEGEFQNLAHAVENFGASTQGDDLLWNIEPRLTKKLDILKESLKPANWDVLDKSLQLIITTSDYNKAAAKKAAFELETSVDNYHLQKNPYLPEEELLNIDKWKSRLYRAVANQHGINNVVFSKVETLTNEDEQFSNRETNLTLENMETMENLEIMTTIEDMEIQVSNIDDLIQFPSTDEQWSAAENISNVTSFPETATSSFSWPLYQEIESVDIQNAQLFTKS